MYFLNSATTPKASLSPLDRGTWLRGLNVPLLRMLVQVELVSTDASVRRGQAVGLGVV